MLRNKGPGISQHGAAMCTHDAYSWSSILSYGQPQWMDHKEIVKEHHEHGSVHTQNTARTAYFMRPAFLRDPCPRQHTAQRTTHRKVLLSMATVYYKLAKNATGVSYTTELTCRRYLRYSTKRRMNARKCSDLRIFPGTASCSMSRGKTGLESKSSPPRPCGRAPWEAKP